MIDIVLVPYFICCDQFRISIYQLIARLLLVQRHAFMHTDRCTEVYLLTTLSKPENSNWDKLGQIGTYWDKLGHMGTNWVLGHVGTIPNLSQHVPICPNFSQFVPICPDGITNTSSMYPCKEFAPLLGYNVWNWQNGRSSCSKL